MIYGWHSCVQASSSSTNVTTTNSTATTTPPGPWTTSRASSLKSPCLRRNSSDRDCCSDAERFRGLALTALLARRTLDVDIACSVMQCVGRRAALLESFCSANKPWARLYTFAAHPTGMRCCNALEAAGEVVLRIYNEQLPSLCMVVTRTMRICMSVGHSLGCGVHQQQSHLTACACTRRAP